MDNKKAITISQISDLIAYEVYNLVIYIRVYEGEKYNTACIIIHNETELSIFIDIFGDPEIDAIEGDLNVVIGNIHFNHLTKADFIVKKNEYIHKVYI